MTPIILVGGEAKRRRITINCSSRCFLNPRANSRNKAETLWRVKRNACGIELLKTRNCLLLIVIQPDDICVVRTLPGMFPHTTCHHLTRLEHQCETSRLWRATWNKNNSEKLIDWAENQIIALAHWRKIGSFSWQDKFGKNFKNTNTGLKILILRFQFLSKF